MKVNIHSTAIVRTPKFSYQSNLTTCWHQLKAAIALSSDAFYQTIKDTSANEIHLLPPKVFFTIWKYYNRAKYRSTPYGTFASVCFLPNAVKYNADRIVVDEFQQEHTFIDWPEKNNLHFSTHDLLEKNCFLFSNSSYYSTADSIRYIACTNGLFELAEIDKDNVVETILDSCLKPIRVNELINLLANKGIQTDSLVSLLSDMHELQLVFTDYDPNILGEDYFQRLNVAGEGLPKYIIAQRAIQSGNIEERVLQHAPNLVDFLQQIVPKEDRDSLGKFKDRFRKKFEQREVPLLHALDPEMGVGYDELEQGEQSDDFVAQFGNRQNRKAEEENSLKLAIGDVLPNQGFEKDQPIFLNKLVIKSIGKIYPLPNTFSLNMSLSDELVCVDQIGAATANGFAGRFSMADADLENQCREIAAIEQDANPAVLFFDVAYMIDSNIDNINRRNLFYDYQLSILNYDTSESPILLNDLMISIQGSEIVLRSKKLNKRVVPKMASAYNYTRSDLSVFRLLCDLQHQGVQTNLSFSLSGMFPDLDYYPRLQYHNILLNRAKWKLN